MDQGTRDWHDWRAGGFGSSDAPVILGLSKYRTRFQLWEEKTGLVKPDTTPNFIQQRGHDLEPKARAHYELLNDLDMPPCLAEHPKYPFILASLDGRNAGVRKSLEIKYMGKEAHLLAREKKVIPDHYVPQLVHQLMVTGDEMVDFVSYNPEFDNIAVVPFYRNLKLEAGLLEAELAFWDLVQKKIPPALVDKDFKLVRDKESVALFNAWKEAADEPSRDEATKIILDRFANKRVRCAGVRLFHDALGTKLYLESQTA